MLAFWVLLKTIFGAIFSVIATVIEFLLDNPRILLLVVIIIASFSTFFYVEHKIHSLDDQIAELNKEKIIWVQSNAIYESNQKLMVEVNTDNQAIIESLKTTKGFLGQQTADLKKANADVTKQISDLQAQIKNAPPSDDGSVSPVLKATIDKIEQLREQRNKLWNSGK